MEATNTGFLLDSGYCEYFTQFILSVIPKLNYQLSVQVPLNTSVEI